MNGQSEKQSPLPTGLGKCSLLHKKSRGIITQGEKARQGMFTIQGWLESRDTIGRVSSNTRNPGKMFFLFIQLSIFVLSPLVTLLHELGHAIPALLVTRKKVTIYIGSYGDPQKSLCFRVGLLEFYVRY